MRILFGWFKGLPYGDCEENFDDYRKLKNTIPKEKVIEHIESDKVNKGATSLATFDIITGERLQAGMFVDGNFAFPFDFLHYYKNYDIGIPYEYEEYLKGIIDY